MMMFVAIRSVLALTLAGRCLTSRDSWWIRGPALFILIALIASVTGVQPIFWLFPNLRFMTMNAAIALINAVITLWYVAALFLLVWQFISSDNKAVRIASGVVGALYLSPIILLVTIAMLMMVSHH